MNDFSDKASYLNPLYNHDFPDPFVFKYCGEYFAVCTGFWHDGGVFGLLRSRDLIHWTDAGSAVNPRPFDQPCYWAPEIYPDNGKFFLYYSVGNEENMEIRVAVADNPAGKYVDSGHRLTKEQFAIDAHVFVDDDNSRWLFYATDFIDYKNIGTGIVRDKMLSPFELAGNPQPVTRAKYDWQIYDPRRASKGNVRWHTVEGAAVVKRKGVYYEMFSGGNWQNVSYGVSFATTRDINQPDEWRQFSDGAAVLPILRTIPEKVIGPGHNSVVRGTDNLQFVCVYHRWADDLSGRLLAIDRMDFVGERILILGASHTPQPAPNDPAISDFFDENREHGLGANWIPDDENNWLTNSGAAISNALAVRAEAVCQSTADSFLVEVSTRAVSFSEQSRFGFCLKNDDQIVLRCAILPFTKQIEILHANKTEVFDLPADFAISAFHLWRVAVDNFAVKIKLDEAVFSFEKQLEIAPQNFALVAETMSAAFAGFALTIGFEDLFERSTNLAARGWQLERGEPDAWEIGGGSLKFASQRSPESVVCKNFSAENFEFVINARFINNAMPDGCYGFYFKQTDGAELILTIERDGEKFVLRIQNSNGARRFDLPESFAPEDFRQFRLRRVKNKLHLQYETIKLGEIDAASEFSRVGLYARRANAEFEMVRLTEL